MRVGIEDFRVESLEFRGLEAPAEVYDGEASTSIGHGKTIIFGLRQRFPEFSAERRAIEISCHYKAVFNSTPRPLAKMGGWLRNYPKEHEHGIQLAKDEGVVFIEEPVVPVAAAEVPGSEESYDGEASVFIFGQRALVFDYKDRFPQINFEDRVWQISEHYKGAWRMTRKPLMQMAGWLRNYAAEHEKGIALAKKDGVIFRD